eukprot:TRINITY_DN4826_c0_g1_i1.p1 TRINITY_DN4826_c0_g1~~TRINITY_DN4826_c0_g1_i1.p1  ORF type:complete len:416 (+),score=59.89 TRINITY_DN4826_c0_g1_i1:107-1354(+)
MRVVPALAVLVAAHCGAAAPVAEATAVSAMEKPRLRGAAAAAGNKTSAAARRRRLAKPLMTHYSGSGCQMVAEIRWTDIPFSDTSGSHFRFELYMYGPGGQQAYIVIQRPGNGYALSLYIHDSLGGINQFQSSEHMLQEHTPPQPQSIWTLTVDLRIGSESEWVLRDHNGRDWYRWLYGSSTRGPFDMDSTVSMVDYAAPSVDEAWHDLTVGGPWAPWHQVHPPSGLHEGRARLIALQDAVPFTLSPATTGFPTGNPSVSPTAHSTPVLSCGANVYQVRPAISGLPGMPTPLDFDFCPQASALPGAMHTFRMICPDPVTSVDLFAPCFLSCFLGMTECQVPVFGCMRITGMGTVGMGSPGFSLGIDIGCPDTGAPATAAPTEAPTTAAPTKAPATPAQLPRRHRYRKPPPLPWRR